MRSNQSVPCGIVGIHDRHHFRTAPIRLVRTEALISASCIQGDVREIARLDTRRIDLDYLRLALGVQILA